MRVKSYILTLLLVTSMCGYSQKNVRVNAIKASDYGVVYSLPKTSFEITLTIKKSTYQRGDFYTFAQRYLAIEDPVIENRVVYSLEDINIENKGIPDKSNSFMVAFRPKSIEPFVFLREDGVIISINAEQETEKSAELVLPAAVFPSENPRRYLSQETLMAGSTSKQAELVARQIFDLRRNRSDILSGEADNMPPDGNAYNVVMSEIDKQEKALTELFAGSLKTEYFTTTVVVVPESNNIDKQVIVRFSEKLGAVDVDDLAGEPIYLSLINKTPKVELQLSDKEKQNLEKKLSQGIVYNIPAKADLKVEFKNKAIKEIEVDVVQFGTKDLLERKMFDNNKQPVKVYFYPELGAIKQVIQL